MSLGPEAIMELKGGPFGGGWVGSVASAWESIAGRDVAGARCRGWTGEAFGWVPLLALSRRSAAGEAVEVKIGARSLLVTPDQGLSVITATGIARRAADKVTVGDIVSYDSGEDWADGSAEPEIDVLSMVSGIYRCQVNVDLRGLTRQQVGLKAWEWQNCQREATYGTRLPVATYLKHRHLFRQIGPVYLGCGRACSSPPFIRLSEWAYVLGFYLGDGWVNHQRVCFAVENPRVATFLNELDKLPVGLNPIVRKMKGKSVEVRCSHRIFSDLMRSVFKDAKCWEKRIPADWITTWSPCARRELLRGLVDSDGYQRQEEGASEMFAYRTCSKGLAHDVVSLLRSLGVRAGLGVSPPRIGGFVRGAQIIGKRISYGVTWTNAILNGGRKGKNRVTATARVPAPSYVYDAKTGDGFSACGMLLAGAGNFLNRRARSNEVA